MCCGPCVLVCCGSCGAGSCGCTMGTCADITGGCCLTGSSCNPNPCGTCVIGNPCNPCNPTAGQDVPLDQLPINSPAANAVANELNQNSLEAPNSPCVHGAADHPPSPIGDSFSPRGGGGSGSGSAKGSAGGTPVNRKAACGRLTALQQLLNRFGALTASLAGKKTSTATGPLSNVGAAKITGAVPSSSGFLLIILVVGALLIIMAWSKGNE